jgi:hypothetical protein
MTEPADQPAKHGRSLTGFYVALGVVAALVGLGVCLHKPIRTRYAIYMVRNTAHGPEDQIPEGWMEWVNLTVEAAARGDRSAMDALISQQSGRPRFWPLCWVPHWPAPHRAAFYEELSHWSDEEVLAVLHSLSESIGQVLGQDEVIEGYRFEVPSTPQNFVVNLKPLAEKAESSEVRATASELIAFVRRRFAKELAEAEKAKAEVPKP